MQINSVGLYSIQSSYYGNKKCISNKNSKNIHTTAQTDAFQVCTYPRRYLPEQYPALGAICTYDSFTKLRDKNYLLNVVNQLMFECKSKGKEFSIGMFDMDNFKSINELLNYKTGDKFILEISAAISEVAKKHSLNVYRFGGEEFVVVFDKGQSPEEKELIAQEILTQVSSNPYINSKASQYLENARKRLDEYIESSSKVSDLIPLKAKRDLLRDLQFNFESNEARNDAYLQRYIKQIDFEIKQLYLELINTRIHEEESLETIANLRKVKSKIGANILLDEFEERALDEYLLSIYDKTFEIHQIKKWIKDFNQNEGFSITGGVIDFNQESVKGKSAIDVINEAGELLKNGKNIHKGRKYFAN